MSMVTLNLRKKIIGLILAVSLATLAIMVVIVFIFIKPRLEAKLEKRGQSIAHAIAAQCIEPILSRQYFQLDLIFREFVDADAGVDHLYVISPEGEIIAHSFGKEFPVELKKLKPKIDKEGFGIVDYSAGKRKIVEISHPLLDGTLGRIHVGVSADSISKDVNEILLSFTGIAGLFSLAMVLLLVFLDRWVIWPIGVLRKAALSVQGGDFDKRVELESADEIGSLAAEFNRMLETIKESRVNLLKEQALLAKSEERLRKIIELSPISMALVALDGTIEYINNYAIDTFGYQPEDIPTMDDWWRRAYPDPVYRQEVITGWMRLVEKAIAEKGYIERSEYLVTCQDGSTKTMLIFGVIVANKVFVIFEDITARKQAEERVRASEASYQIFTSITSDYVYKCLRRGSEPFRIQWMAGATEAITGYSIEELKQMACWLQIVHPDDRERASRFLLGLSAGDKAVLDFRIIAKGGDVRWIHESSYCETGDSPGELVHYGSSQDITARKKVEDEIKRLNLGLEALVDERTTELLRSNRDLTSFCYAISHELRAPVARIKGLSQALQEEWAENPEDAQYCAQRIEVASSELQRVINSVLQLSRLSQTSFVPQPLNLSVLVRKIANSLTGENPQRQVELIIADNMTASGDPSLMELCLENLLGNAFKFTARESLARIEFGRDAASNAFFIRDNGTGFDMNHADNMFEPFVRLHGEKEFNGSGIGLATVQRIIERHGGTIWAESAPGAGATFYFILSPSSGDSHDA